MALNKNYGRASQNQIQYAPRSFKEDGVLIVPRVDDDGAYLSRGWFKVVECKPKYDPEKYALKQTGWDEDTEAREVFAVYELVEIQPAPVYMQVRRFSKLKLVEFCMEKGIWRELKAFLEGLGYYDLFVMAMVFLENDKFFKRGLQAFKAHKVQEEGYDAQELQELISQALAYAFDAYETVLIEQEENQQQ